MKSSDTALSDLKRHGQLAILLIVTAMAVACSNGGSNNTGTSPQSPPPAQKSITSIVVTPVNATLFLNTQQQLVAVASYSDGSAQDITGSAQWSSSSPATALVSQSGLVSATAAGSATISVSSSSASASATITVSAATSGVSVVDDLTDSRLMTFWPGDGSLLTYYGTRNADGSIAAITSVRVAANQQSSIFTFDGQGRESTALLADGTQMGFDWTNPSSPTLALIAPDHSGVQTVACSTAPAGSAPVGSARLRQQKTSSRRNARQARAMASNSGNPSSALINVTTDCGSGPKPEDNAIVDVNVSYAFGGGPPGPIPAWSLGSGKGEYYANLPSGPTSLAPSALQSSAAQALSDLCNIPIPSYAASLCGPWAAECQAANKAFWYVCKAQSVAQSTFSVINFLNKLAPPTVTADVSTDGYPPGSATYEGINFGAYVFQAGPFQCKVDKVFVAPNPASATVGQAVPLGAYATGLDATSVPYIITSSVLRWSWQPNPSDNYLQVTPLGTSTPNGFQGTQIGVALANVVGKNSTPQGSPDTVTAVETNSGASGSAQVTVQSGSYSVTNIDYPGATSTYALGINDTGTVVGWYIDAKPSVHGFLYSNGSYRSLDYPGADGTYASGISANGQIVGWYGYNAGNIPHGLLYNGAFTTIDNPACQGTQSSPGGTQLVSVNDSGQIIGYCSWPNPGPAPSAFLYGGGSSTTIAYPGASGTNLSKINNNGDIVGNGDTPTSIIGFVYSSGSYNAVNFTGSIYTSLFSINDNGQIFGVGVAQGPVLNDFIETAGKFSAITIPTAANYFTDINDAGVIVGTGCGTSGGSCVATPQ